MSFRNRFSLFALLFAVMFSASCGKAPAQRNSAGQAILPVRPTIVFMTDFGTANDAVAICKAVILGIAPDARVMDITHQVTPYKIDEAARLLAGVTPYYPAGTIFLAVIDPGVGTSRKAVIVKSKKGQYFVVPDNGLVTPVLQRDGLDSAREITNSAWMLAPQVSSTFQGRDIFSPAAAHLAAGWDFALAGPVVPQLVQLTEKTSAATEKGIQGDVIALDDPYGSLITDIPGDEFKKLGYELGDKILIQLDKKFLSLPYARTFMDVPVGEPLLYVDSRGRISIALNQGNFSLVHKIAPPAPIFIPRKGAPIKK
ncbi:MAG TPA: SAM-dependent chlorinase/fluorinase [Candidatus Acidoferrum sp.]|nr:SAM-dependent chlorinase/fluorinase [Candidatus Acidoferrum sp.]